MISLKVKCDKMPNTAKMSYMKEVGLHFCPIPFYTYKPHNNLRIQEIQHITFSKNKFQVS